MSYIKCSSCHKDIRFVRKDSEMVDEKYLQGIESIYCMPCFTEKEEEKNK